MKQPPGDSPEFEFKLKTFHRITHACASIQQQTLTLKGLTVLLNVNLF